MGFTNKKINVFTAEYATTNTLWVQVLCEIRWRNESCNFQCDEITSCLNAHVIQPKWTLKRPFKQSRIYTQNTWSVTLNRSPPKLNFHLSTLYYFKRWHRIILSWFYEFHCYVLASKEDLKKKNRDSLSATIRKFKITDWKKKFAQVLRFRIGFIGQ